MTEKAKEPYIKRKELVLTTKAPLFIGDGEKLTKKEFVLIPKTKQVYMMDPVSFFRWLDRNNLVKAYEEFAQDVKQKRLYEDFFQKHLYQGETNQQKKIQQELDQLDGYSVSAGNCFVGKDSKQDPLREIHTCIKDAYGNPYVPGSSIKGALRTAILAKMLSGKGEAIFLDKEKEAKGQQKEKMKHWSQKSYQEISSISQKIENNSLNLLNLDNEEEESTDSNNALTSILRGISISDSIPIPKENLIICPKIDYVAQRKNQNSSTDEIHFRYNRIPIMRECIKPETEIHFQIALNDDYLDDNLKDTKINFDYLEEAIQAFYELQNNWFVRRFRGWENYGKENDCRLYLGGGAGFHSKTLLQAIYHGDAAKYTSTILQKLFEEHQHCEDYKKPGISPRALKITKYDNTNFLMGECEVEFR
ncbi:type III-A CRISPR-associated RAMP protein Csm5 [Massilioclostridium coli]|uniref:type III-A CRISPR-associated RAMP protein Csm5 n=1 Tax=Massilioclostridium coli TaxID=1870991 RepID=UPI00085C6140|nr:type III-A CRISPR-associated RAMP protein Csm5 [Massilioclostridium coli]